MKQEMDNNNILWVELRTQNGYKRFEEVLNELSIPCQPFRGKLQEDLERILPIILSDDIQTSVTPIIKEGNAEFLIKLD